MFLRAGATWKDARTNETNACFKLKHEAHPESYRFTTWKDTWGIKKNPVNGAFGVGAFVGLTSIALPEDRI